MERARKKFELIFFCGLALYCLTIPFDISINNLTFVAIIIGWWGESSWKEKWKKTTEGSPALLLVLYYLFSLITLIYSDNNSYGFRVLETQLKLLIFPILIVSSSSISNNKIRLIKICWILSCVILGAALIAIALTKYLDTGSTSFFFYHGLTEPLKGLSAIYYANYLALACLFVLFLEPTNNGNRYQALRFFLLSFMLLVIFLLSGLAVIVFTFVMFFILSNRWLSEKIGFWKSQFATIFLVVLLIIIVSFIPYTSGKIGKLQDMTYELSYPDSLWNSATIRLAIWECGIEAMKKNVVLGTGVGDEIDDLFSSYKEKGFSEGLRCEYNMHNQYLSTYLIGGFPLLLLLLIILVFPLKLGIKNKDIVLVGFICLIAITLLTENFLRLHKGVSFFSFFYSILIISNARKNL